MIDILDIWDVSSYVRRTAKLFYPHREHQEGLARDRLLRILQGNVRGVIAGLRQMATERAEGKAPGGDCHGVRLLREARQAVRYDEYLAADYLSPPASSRELGGTWSRIGWSGAAFAGG